MSTRAPESWRRLTPSAPRPARAAEGSPDPAPAWTFAPRPALVGAFRAALAARGAPEGMRVSVLSRHADLDCARCLRAAARSLGLRYARVRPGPGERGLFEEHEHLWWRWRPPRQDEVGRAIPGRFQVPSRDPFGLLRVAAPGAGAGEGLWLWALDEVRADDATELLLVAHRRSGLLRRYLGEVCRLHRERERRRPGLLFLEGSRERRVRCERVGWNDLLLPPTTKDELERTVREFFAARELYRRHRVGHRRGLLLAGPPGNGKTTILRAIRSSLDVPVLVAGPGRDGTCDLAQAFRRAAELAPSVLCFEDVDLLLGEASELARFLNLLDGLEPLEGVLVVATTNHPERIDPALTSRPSRFDRLFQVPNPSRELRARYLRRCLASEELEDALIEELLDGTADYSVAFLKELVLQARLGAVRSGAERVGRGPLLDALAATREHRRLAEDGSERGPLGFAGQDDDDGGDGDSDE